MRVNKTTWLDCGSGTPEDITKALKDSSIPAHAVLVAVESEGYRVHHDKFSSGVFGPVRVKFEWIDDE